MPDKQLKLPVESILTELADTLGQSPAVVLQAPPGSGKTTRVPLALLDAPWLDRKRILMVEPRRLAATNAARYMAELRGEKVGKSVGYSIRYEQKTSSVTRLEIMTEGLLTRRLQGDAELDGVGLVIFDEFHERSLQADLALALCRDIQTGLRDDLRILVMSATLDSEPLSRLLGDCPIITTSGRSFPVAIDYLAQGEEMRIAEATTLGVRHALANGSGDILAFLPGAGEIRRCQSQLLEFTDEIDLRPLFGGLNFADQEAAILPGKRRRVVLATNVAETSLTIEGIESVVDSGWERRPRFDAARGTTRLETVRISQASAAQRAGRAGRLGPGRCYRLWSEGTQGALLPYAPPEIRQADLAQLAFELAQWGVHDVASLPWLDPPPAGQLAAGRQLLTTLGALDTRGAVTALGKEMSRYPTDPRLGRLLVAAVKNDCAELGCELAALLEERDLLGHYGTEKAHGSSDLLIRLELLRKGASAQTKTVQRAVDDWRWRTRATKKTSSDVTMIGRLLAAAYPDRIGRWRQPGSKRYQLANGQGVALGEASVVRDSEWLVAVDVVGRKGAEDEIRIASSLSRELVEELFGHTLHWQREAGWDEREDRVTAKEVRRLGALVLQERPVAVSTEDTLPALLSLIRRKGLEILPWTREARQLQARTAFLHKHLSDQGWTDVSDPTLLNDLDEWLSSWLAGVTNRSNLKRIDLPEALKAHIGWQKLKELDRLAPQRLEVPSGSQVRIDYTLQETPVLAVKLQEMFGLAETPCLAGGRVPVLIHLLSPAGRPLAVTGDLKNFWDTVYPEVKKEMKGRYPKHPWPDDPWNAQATKRTKRRS